ncbi:Uncharacterized protein FWK35_00019958 [Aphis craccivora]|uniref:Uncharacterized protein n=1 Tax=Aphis craccivora TaxID=307492 RepID=A0A6G0Y918_APHCR|nr:Uncharacterized protein FWK35_00019958 [Aphis craccivora]
MNVLILQCCVFFFYYFVAVYTRTCRNNASISNFEGGFLSDRKMNLVGALGRLFFEILNSF